MIFFNLPHIDQNKNLGIISLNRLIKEHKYIQQNVILMTKTQQLSVSKTSVSKIAILALAIVFAVGLFVVGFDQGHIFSLVYGEQAFVDLSIHELTHDMRHAAGFPCH